MPGHFKGEFKQRTHPIKRTLVSTFDRTVRHLALLTPTGRGQQLAHEVLKELGKHKVWTSELVSSVLQRVRRVPKTGQTPETVFLEYTLAQALERIKLERRSMKWQEVVDARRKASVAERDALPKLARFAAAQAHELNNILSSLSWADLFTLSDLPRGPAHEPMERIGQLMFRVTELTSALRDQPQPRRIQTAETSPSQVKPAYGQLGASVLDLDVAPELTDTIHDPGLTAQVIDRLAQLTPLGRRRQAMRHALAKMLVSTKVDLNGITSDLGLSDETSQVIRLLGQPSLVGAFKEQILPHKRSAAGLKHDLDWARQATAAKRESIAAINDQLKGLLSVVARHLRRAKAATHRAGTDAKTKDSVDTTAGLIERSLLDAELHLLQLELLSSGKEFQVTRKPMDRAEFTLRIEENLSKWAQKYGAKLKEVAFDASVPSTIVLDPQWMMVALRNPVKNAAEAAPKPGATEISIRAHLEENQLVLSVIDNGKGIPEDKLEDIGQFGNTFGKKDGNGYGLWLTTEVAEKHGGTWEVTSDTSKDHHGTTVTLKIPGVTLLGDPPDPQLVN